MKFLCVACDRQMELAAAGAEGAAGSLAARFRCPGCGQEIAMLTNPWETEVVQSLGVRVGGGPGCPFAAASGAGAAAAEDGAEPPPAGGAPMTAGGAPSPGSLAWTAGALSRLDRIPEFVRPMARQGIEHFARGQGRTLVTEEVLEEARAGIAG